MSSDCVGDVSRPPTQRGPPRSIVGMRQAALDVHHARVDSSPAAAYSSAPMTAASTGSISPAARKSGKYEAASPVTSSPAVAKGKVVVATADGQVICFGSRQTPTVDSVSPKGVHFHSSSMQREADERSEDEEQERAASGHARDVDSEDAVDRVDARLRHRAAHPDAV